MRKYKVIVAHPGKQHSFRLATALKKENLLLSYITTVYDKNSLFMRLIKAIVGENNAKRAESRHCNELDNKDVLQYYEVSSLITLLLLRIDKSKKLYSKWDRSVSSRFGKKVAKYAISTHADMVIMYDANAADCFEYLKQHAPGIKRVMDVSHSNRLYEKKLFEEDMVILPEWADSIRKEKRYLWESDLSFVKKENELTQFFLVPSTYVKRTLVQYGIGKERILITPYGVDVDRFVFRETEKNNNQSQVYFLYVGNATEMKGFGHLLVALQKVNQVYPGTNMHFVGGTLNPSINSKYGNHVISHGYLQFEDMVKMYQNADVMVIPSLSEGMTLSGLEALCCGLPLICTTNSGINDLIEEGKNGFVIDISDSDQIAEKMIWFIQNKNRIPEMKKNAHMTGSKYTWDKYYTDISKKIHRLLEG